MSGAAGRPPRKSCAASCCSISPRAASRESRTIRRRISTSSGSGREQEGRRAVRPLERRSSLTPLMEPSRAWRRFDVVRRAELQREAVGRAEEFPARLIGSTTRYHGVASCFT